MRSIWSRQPGPLPGTTESDAGPSRPAQFDLLENIHSDGGLAGIVTLIGDVDRILAGEYLLPP